MVLLLAIRAEVGDTARTSYMSKTSALQLTLLGLDNMCTLCKYTASGAVPGEDFIAPEYTEFILRRRISVCDDSICCRRSASVISLVRP